MRSIKAVSILCVAVIFFAQLASVVHFYSVPHKWCAKHHHFIHHAPGCHSGDSNDDKNSADLDLSHDCKFLGTRDEPEIIIHYYLKVQK